MADLSSRYNMEPTPAPVEPVAPAEPRLEDRYSQEPTVVTPPAEPIIRAPKRTDRAYDPPKDPLDLVSKGVKRAATIGYEATKGMTAPITGAVQGVASMLDPLVGLIQAGLQGKKTTDYDGTPYAIEDPFYKMYKTMTETALSHPTDLLGGSAVRARNEGSEVLSDPAWWGEAGVDAVGNLTLLPAVARTMGAARAALPTKVGRGIDKAAGAIVPKYNWTGEMIGAEGRNQGSKMLGGVGIERHMKRLADIDPAQPLTLKQQAAMNRVFKTIQANDTELQQLGAGTHRELTTRIDNIIAGQGTVQQKAGEILDLQLHAKTNHQLFDSMANMAAFDGRPTIFTAQQRLPGGAPSVFGTKPAHVPADYVQVPENASLFGNYRGSWVHPDVADVLPTLQRKEPAMNVWQRYVAAWKASKTIWSPNTHLNNVLGDGMFAHLAGVNPLNPMNVGYYREAKQLLEAFSSGSIHPMLREAMESGAVREGFANMELQRARGHLAKNPGATQPFEWLTDSRAAQKARDIYDTEDMVFRLAAYLKNRHRGLDARTAGAEVNKYFPAYSSTSMMGRAMRGPFGGPFTSFPLEAARIYITAAREQPWRLAGAGALMETALVANLAQMDMTMEDWQEFKRNLPSHMRDRALIPFRNPNGDMEISDMSSVLPLGDVLHAGDSMADSGPGRSLILGGPIWNTIKATIGYDWNLDRKIGDPARGEGFKDQLGELVTGLAPVPSTIPLGKRRIQNAIAETPYRSGGEPESVPSAAWHSLFPTTDARSADQLAQQGYRERKGRVSEAKRGKRSIRKNDTLRPDEKEERLQRSMDEVIRRRYQ